MPGVALMGVGDTPRSIGSLQHWQLAAAGRRAGVAWPAAGHAVDVQRHELMAASAACKMVCR